MTHSELFRQIEELVPTLGDWSTPQKCCEFAAIVIATRPLVTVELGVWCGPGVFSMALAHRINGTGKSYAVDPWSSEASAVGQDGENEKWWNDQAKHEYAFNKFVSTKAALSLEPWIDVQRTTSDKATIPDNVGLLLIDGNHGPQAVKDVERWAPSVTRAGFVYLDDLGWAGGAVAEAGNLLIKLGFSPLWQRDTGMFYQRSR
jgi:hypothetical protein